MRRIIERIVTVVTTTTWKISWELEKSPQDHSAGKNSDDFVQSELLTSTSPDTNQNSSEIEEMKVDQTEKVEIDVLSEDEP